MWFLPGVRLQVGPGSGLPSRLQLLWPAPLTTSLQLSSHNRHCAAHQQHTKHTHTSTLCQSKNSSLLNVSVYKGCHGREFLCGGGSWSSVRGARGITTTAPRCLFWERDPKGGYGQGVKKSRKELIRDGLKELREELSKWQEEVHEKFDTDPIIVRPGDMDKVWVLDRPEALDQWVVTSDSDHGEGSSEGSLTLSPTCHGLFTGHINTAVPKDGKVKRAGYSNIKSIRPRKSFKREVYLDWTLYNHLELRLRGDGRTYLLNISTSGYFDVTWNDVYTYPLYTRGGPHWQVTRIPFANFFLSSKGRVQDKQASIPLDQVVSLSISAGDRVNAPFRLEIDYIGVYLDPNYTETFSYEMYRLPKFMVGQ